MKDVNLLRIIMIMIHIEDHISSRDIKKINRKKKRNQKNRKKRNQKNR